MQHFIKSQIQSWGPLAWLTILLPSLEVMACDIYTALHPEAEFGLFFIQLALLALWVLTALIFACIQFLRNPGKLIPLAISFIGLALTTIALLRFFPLGDYVHLAIEYPRYSENIALAPNHRHPFRWGSMGWFLLSCNRTLLYDPSDELQEEKARQKQYAQASYSDRVRLVIKPLFGHFYVIEEWLG